MNVDLTFILMKYNTPISVRKPLFEYINIYVKQRHHHT